MTDHQYRKVKKALLTIDPPYPPDDLVVTYADFLRIREDLPYYQFNCAVFSNLLRLATEKWNASDRISRLSLLQRIKQYYRGKSEHKGLPRPNYSVKTANELPLSVRQQVFDLFRKLFEESQHISSRQLEEARQIGNNLMINLALTEMEEKWLCEHATSSDYILNRLLRYPNQSMIISSWAANNLSNRAFSTRRAELISWLIDTDPTFVVDKQILIDDFDYLNKLDQQAIQAYEDELAANTFIERELSNYLPKSPEYNAYEDVFEEKTVELSAPELKLSKRPYPVAIDLSRNLPVFVPNFKQLWLSFHRNLTTFHQQTMVWGITYSRLDNSRKTALLKEYYNDKTVHSIFKIARKTKNAELLRWMLEQLESDKEH